MEEQQKELSKILGIDNGDGYSKKPASWAEIYVEIGKLKERAERPPEVRYMPSLEPMPLGQSPYNTYAGNPNLHYHGQEPCYNNPCFRV